MKQHLKKTIIERDKFVTEYIKEMETSLNKWIPGHPLPQPPPIISALNIEINVIERLENEVVK